MLVERGTFPVHGCRCVRLSPDGLSLVIASPGLLEMWDITTGRRVWCREHAMRADLPVVLVWTGPADAIAVLAGARLSVRDAFTGAELALPTELGERTDVTALALAPDGRTFAVGTSGGSVLLWDQDTGRTRVLHGGGDPVTALAWRPTMGELCVARQRALQLWSPAAEMMRLSIDVADTYPTQMVWLPDGSRIVLSGLRAVRVLDPVERDAGLPALRTDAPPRGLGVGRTGTTVLVGMPDGSVQVLDSQLRSPEVPGTRLPASVGEPAALHVNETGLLAVPVGASVVGLFALPDTARPAAEQHRRVVLRRWAVRLVAPRPPAAGEELAAPVPTTVARRARFAWATGGWFVQDRESGRVSHVFADGRLHWQQDAAAGPLSLGNGLLTIEESVGRLTVLDAGSGTRIGAGTAGAGRVSFCAHAAAYLAADRRDILVDDPAVGGRIRTLPVSDGEAGEPRWSPDGAVLAAATDGGVVLWNSRPLQRAGRLAIGADGAAQQTVLAWAPDSRTLAITWPGGSVTRWDRDTWRPLGRPLSGTTGAALAWSPDSQLLAVPAKTPLGAVEVWQVHSERMILLIPPAPDGRQPVSGLYWAADGRFAVGYDDGTIIGWELTLPVSDERPWPEPRRLAALATATAMLGGCPATAVLTDLFSLLSGEPAGPLEEFRWHPGVIRLRMLRWPPDAVVGLAVLLACGLPAEDGSLPPEGMAPQELYAAARDALLAPGALAAQLRDGYPVPTTELQAELDRVDDAVLLLAGLLGPGAVAHTPDLLARMRAGSFGQWSFAPRQRQLLGLHTALRSAGSSQGHGVGDTRAGIARHGDVTSLLPSQLALPRVVLGAKMTRDELLYRTRQGELAAEARSLVLVLDDTAAAFGAIGTMLRLIANLLAGISIRHHRRCALVFLGSPVVRVLGETTDLVHIWSAPSLERASLPAALTRATRMATRLGDPLGGRPRLVLLTHPYLRCPSRPDLHVVRVRYPGVRVSDAAARTYLVAPDAGPEELRRVVGAVLAEQA